MEQHIKAVEEILGIYITRTREFMEVEEKIVCLTGLFDYLSTGEVKRLLQTPHFAAFRNMLLHKIHQFKNDQYIIAGRKTYHRLHTVMDEMFTYLVQDDSIPRRRSERQKKQAVQRFNRSFQQCTIAAELKYWNDVQAGKKLPKVSIKVLPRRSARLNKL